MNAKSKILINTSCTKLKNVTRCRDSKKQAFLSVATSSSQELACFTDIKVGEQMVKFKLNTDAEK